MASQSIVLIIILISLSSISLSSFAQKHTAKRGCDYLCGNITIPYPFGMKDPNCYADQPFEIECDTTSQIPKPILKSLKLELRYIEPSKSRFWVMHPLYFWNCTKTIQPNISLDGTPFVYSSEEPNIFIAVGCYATALMVQHDQKVGGCVTFCDGYDVKEELRTCRGRYCCETSLPTFLREYKIERHILPQKEKYNDSQCNYAMIIDENFLMGMEYFGKYSRTTEKVMESLELHSMDYVPAVLEWEITNKDLELKTTNAVTCLETNITATSATSSSTGRRCSCNEGFDGNPYLPEGCTVQLIQIEDERGLVIVHLLGFGLVLLFAVWRLKKFLKKRRKKKLKEKYFKQNGGMLLQQRLASGETNADNNNLFTLKDLEKATDRFNVNRILGKGGQGTVYKGMLVDGRIVAVKKFIVQGMVEEFINEIAILSQINHRNVVKLLGCCLETEVPLLIYEFIPNGTLFEYLHEQKDQDNLPMTWEMRLRIATEVAGALYYLHSAASQPIYHRDIKSSNILLDEKYRAKVADFGASRMLSGENTHLTTMVQGTFGYLDPEYFHTSQFTDKSDVYSFGVVLVELLTGERAISPLRPESLSSHFIASINQNHLFAILDERVKKEGEKEEIIQIANLAKSCLHLNGKKRPTMREAAIELHRIQKMRKNCFHEEDRTDSNPPWIAHFSPSTVLELQDF